MLKETFAKANLTAEIEVYTDAAHGWARPIRALQRTTSRKGLESTARVVRESFGLSPRPPA